MQEDPPPHYDHSGYRYREAFSYFSTRNINFGRILNFSSLDFMNFNQIMRRLKQKSFARLNKPSYPSLIRRFYGNLTKPSKSSLHLVATLGDVEIELDLSSMFRILDVNDEGAEVIDSNSWPIVENFNPQKCIRCLFKSNALILKPKSIDLTLEARLILLFVQHNILPRGGHLSEPTYVDLWLVYSIMMGSRKVNLSLLIIQHMSQVLTSFRSILPYGMLLTTIFQSFGVYRDSEVDIRMSKPFDNIDNA